MSTTGLDIDAVRSANPLEDVVEALLNQAPRRAGRELKFSCPFHAHDDHPSLHVNVEASRRSQLRMLEARREVRLWHKPPMAAPDSEEARHDR